MLETSSLYLSIVVFSIISIAFCVMQWRKNGPLSIHAMVALILFSQFGLYPVYARIYADFSYPITFYNFSHKDLMDAGITALASAALVTYIVGVLAIEWRMARAKRAPEGDRRLIFDSTWAEYLRCAWMVAWAICGISYLLLYRFIADLGGIEGLLFALAAYRSGAYAGTGMYTYPATVLLPVTFLYLLNLVLRMPSLSGRSVTGMLLLLGAATLPPLLLGFRIGLVIFWISCLVVYGSARKIRIGRLVAGTILALGFFAAYGTLRESVERLNALQEGISRTPIQEILSPLTRARATDIVEEVLNHPVSREWFMYAVPESISTLVPREVRPEFPLSGDRFGEQVMLEYLFYQRGLAVGNLGGHSPNLIGYGLWQGGILGLLLISFLLGAFCAFLAATIQNQQWSRWKTPFFALAMSAAVHALEAPQDALNSFLTRSIFLLAVHCLVSMLASCRSGVMNSAIRLSSANRQGNH